MDTSMIPGSIKQQLLEQMKGKVGSEQYRELVNRFGEDGLIRLAQLSSAQMEKPKASVWRRAWNSRLFRIVGYCCTPFIYLYFILHLLLFPMWMSWEGIRNLLVLAPLAAVNFVCFNLFATVVDRVAGIATPAGIDVSTVSFTLGLGITVSTYLLCAAVLSMADLIADWQSNATLPSAQIEKPKASVWSRAVDWMALFWALEAICLQGLGFDLVKMSWVVGVSLLIPAYLLCAAVLWMADQRGFEWRHRP